MLSNQGGQDFSETTEETYQRLAREIRRRESGPTADLSDEQIHAAYTAILSGDVPPPKRREVGSTDLSEETEALYERYKRALHDVG